MVVSRLMDSFDFEQVVVVRLADYFVRVSVVARHFVPFVDCGVLVELAVPYIVDAFAVDAELEHSGHAVEVEHFDCIEERH